MGIFDFFKRNKSKTTEVSVRQDDDREDSRLIIGEGIAINSSIQKSSAQAAEKYARAGYNPQTRKTIYDDGAAHKAAIDRAFEGNNIVRDPYTGAELVGKQRDAKLLYGGDWQSHVAEADHIDPLSQIVKRTANNPFLTEDDIRTIGNADDNFQIMSRRLNQTNRDVGKGGSTQREWADSDTRMEGIAEISETGESASEISRRIRDTGKAAEKRNDGRFFKRSVKNAVGTAHDAGMAGAKNAGTTAATMSGIMNLVSVIKGEKSGEDAIADTVRDGGKAAVTGYAMGGGITVISQSLCNSSSEFIQALARNNVPGKVITAVMVTGDTLKKWGEGEISTQECIIELGDKGLNMATMGYSMAVGQSLIPIPIVGGAVGALVGSMLTSELYDSLISELQNRQLKHKERMRIIEECNAVSEQARRYREELENYLNSYFQEYRTCFNDALSSMRLAFEMGDADGVIASANDITRKLGGQVKYENVKEFKNFLDDDSVDVF